MSSAAAASAAATGLLVVVFLWSGAAKVAKPFGAALALTRFRLARHVRPAAARAIGAGELALSFALLLDPRGTWSLAAAAVLLAVFTAVVARAVRAGEAFPCACFGHEQRPISTLTLVRNLGLVAVACAAAAGAAAGARTTVADRAYGIVLGALLVCTLLIVDRLAQTQPFRSDLGTIDGTA
jgi:Methylamine utilisation protein MauE